MTKRERADLLALIGLFYKYAARSKRDTSELRGLAADLTDIAKSLHRCYENDCNYQVSKRQQTREANLEDAGRAVIARVRFLTSADIRISFQGDPRGLPIKLHMPNGERNGWDESWNV